MTAIQCDNLQDVQHYFLRKAREVAVLLPPRSAVLKTDAWNEVVGSVNGFETVPVVGELGRSVEWTYVIEYRDDRAKAAREMFRDERVIVLRDDLRTVEARWQFDAIFDLSTISYMPWDEAKQVLAKYHRWLKPGAPLAIAPWLTAGEATSGKGGWMPDWIFRHNAGEFIDRLQEFFIIVESESVYAHAGGVITMFVAARNP